jgi:hypothetical protein
VDESIDAGGIDDVGGNGVMDKRFEKGINDRFCKHMGSISIVMPGWTIAICGICAEGADVLTFVVPSAELKLDARTGTTADKGDTAAVAVVTLFGARGEETCRREETEILSWLRLRSRDDRELSDSVDNNLGSTAA